MGEKVNNYIWTGALWVPMAGTAGGAMSIHAIVEELNDVEDVDVAAPTDLYILYWNDANGKWECRAFTDWMSNVITITFIIDGGGAEIALGEHGHLEIPFACTITQVTMLADQLGSIEVDIWKDVYANFPPTVADTITAAALPTIAGATKSQDGALVGWTTAITAGDILAFNVDSVTDIERVTISLKVTKT